SNDPLGVDRDDDGPVHHFLTWLGIGVWLWDQRVQPIGRLLSCHHEDDQKHQQNINEGGHIHVHHDTLAPPELHSHTSTLLTCIGSKVEAQGAPAAPAPAPI